MTNSEIIEPAYVLDTHTLIWYLMKSKRLGSQARSVFQAAQRGETQLIVSAVVIAEMYYADKKWGLFDDFSQTYAELKDQPCFQFATFSAEDVLDFAQDSAVPEMHDRIIAGLARRLGVPVVTSDPMIVASGISRTLW